MTRKPSFKLLILLAVFVLVTFFGQTLAAWRTTTLDIQFVHYTQAGLPEQDVFIEPYNVRDDIPSAFIYPVEPHNPRADIPSEFIEPRDILVPQVMRVAGADAQTRTNLAKRVFAADIVTPHDPYQLGPNPLGPFQKGAALDLTLGQWLAAGGHGAYGVEGDHAELTLSFQKLVPLGRYILWCTRVAAPPRDTTVEKTCGAPGGLLHSFSADAQGQVALHLRLQVLPDSTQEMATILTLTYERDVVTWDGDLGGYGLNSHVQLFSVLPPTALTMRLESQAQTWLKGRPAIFAP